MGKLYTKCENCDEIVTETFDDECNSNLQAMLKSASVNHNCQQIPLSSANTNKSAAIEEQEEESAFISLYKSQFGHIRSE